MNAFIGEIRAFPYTFVPEGWLPCDGSDVAINMYQGLYAVIGQLYGTPGSSQTFKLPNIQGRVVAGCDNRDSDFYTVGITGGNIAVALTSVNQITPHTHVMRGFTHNPQTQNSTIYNTPSSLRLLTNASTKPASGTAVVQKCYSNTRNTPVQLNQGTLSPVGLAEAHENRQPYLTFRWGINVDGMYPVKP